MKEIFNNFIPSEVSCTGVFAVTLVMILSVEIKTNSYEYVSANFFYKKNRKVRLEREISIKPLFFLEH